MEVLLLVFLVTATAYGKTVNGINPDKYVSYGKDYSEAVFAAETWRNYEASLKNEIRTRRRQNNADFGEKVSNLFDEPRKGRKLKLARVKLASRKLVTDPQIATPPPIYRPAEIPVRPAPDLIPMGAGPDVPVPARSAPEAQIRYSQKVIPAPENHLPSPTEKPAYAVIIHVIETEGSSTNYVI